MIEGVFTVHDSLQKWGANVGEHEPKRIQMKIKKLLSLMTCATIVFLPLTACGTGGDFNGLKKSKYGEITTGTVKLVLDKKSYPLTDQNNITYKIVNDSTKRITFGAPAELDIHKNDSWYVIPLVRNATWLTGKKNLNPGETFSHEFSLLIYGYQFTKGSYRIVKTYSAVNNSTEISISAEFNLN